MLYTNNALVWLSLVLEERFGFKFFIRHLDSGLALYISEITGSYILFPMSEPAFRTAQADMPCTQWHGVGEGWVSRIGQPLPAPGVSVLPKPLIVQKEDHHLIQYDILGLTYWALNRIEEIDSDKLDSHGRFPAVHSHAYKHKYLDRPVVDEWLHLLGQVIQRQWPELRCKQHQFKMQVSHDVDAPSRYGFCSFADIPRKMIGDLVRGNNYKSIISAPLIRLNSKTKLHPVDIYNTFDWIMSMSEDHNLVSAFYFICGRTSELDADYELEHSSIRELLRRIHLRGHEVGLHPSYGTFNKPELILLEAQRLRKVMNDEGVHQENFGGRMHYLRWEHPGTLQALSDAGLSYDSTLGYADLPGFRCGTCFEYPGFNPITQNLLKIRIRPLVVMECTVISSRYMNLGCGENALNEISKLKAYCRQVDGCFTLLWHNSHFTTRFDRMLYADIIQS